MVLWCNGMAYQPRTQKTKGVVVLSHTGLSVPSVLGLIQSSEGLIKHTNFPAFARPCPRRPRHGFVDSRVVNNLEELTKVYEETIAADDQGEVLLMSPIKALWSAVWTPSLLTIGDGNDGATAGRDVISFPLMRTKVPLYDYDNLLKWAEISPEEDPYVEIVGSKHGFYYTQLRAGTRLGKVTKNFIPFDLTVKEVIPTERADGEGYSLLEWEKLMESVKDHDGVVVYHPSGSLTDHFSVHARTHGIPIILTGEVPKIGTVIEKESEEVHPSPEAVLRGIAIGEQIPIPGSPERSDTEPFIALMLAGLYNAFAMDGDFGKWIGISAALMVRFGNCALAGEARHLESRIKEEKGGTSNKQMPQRHQIYAKNFPYTLTRHRSRVNRLINILRYGFGNGGGVGGQKWALCGMTLFPLYNTISLLAREPSEVNVGKLIRALNVSVDQAHNNGWWMNKFCSGKELFNGIQAGQVKFLIKAIKAIRTAGQFDKEIVPSHIQKRINEWAKWGELVYTPIRVQAAEVVSLPASDIPLVVSFTARLTRGVKKDLVVPLDYPILPIKGDIYLTPGTNGLRVEARKGKKSTLIYEEEALL